VAGIGANLAYARIEGGGAAAEGIERKSRRNICSVHGDFGFAHANAACSSPQTADSSYLR
jgi:hypothetical protein